MTSRKLIFFFVGCAETVIGFVDHDDMFFHVTHIDVVSEDDETVREGFQDFMKFMQNLRPKCAKLASYDKANNLAKRSGGPMNPMFRVTKGKGAHGTTIKLVRG